MTLRIVDNKKLEMTDDEWRMYQKICESYDTPTFDGKSLFKNLFESDKAGIIIFLVPPDGKYCSLEVYLFLMSIMQNQHLRIMHQKLDQFIEDTKKQIEEKLTTKKSK